MKNLQAIRREIVVVMAEIDEVDTALPPLSECEQRLRSELERLCEPFDRFRARCVDAATTGDGARLTPHPDDFAALAVATALRAIGVDTLVAEAMAATPDGDLRMTRAERNERLADLKRRLYALNADEEAAVMTTGERRRPGANAAAVLGIPIDVAEQANLLDEGTR